MENGVIKENRLPGKPVRGIIKWHSKFSIVKNKGSVVPYPGNPVNYAGPAFRFFSSFRIIIIISIKKGNWQLSSIIILFPYIRESFFYCYLHNAILSIPGKAKFLKISMEMKGIWCSALHSDCKLQGLFLFSLCYVLILSACVR